MSDLLIVDDEPSICWGLRRYSESCGHQVMTASSAEEALETLRVATPDVIIIDVRLPGMTGLAAIEHIRRQHQQIPIIVITAYGDLETAVEAVKQGAFEYIVKPFDLETIGETLQRALLSASATTKRPTASAPGPERTGLIGRSPAMQDVYKKIAIAAASDSSVLLHGESGTGKELAARAIHRYSRRGSGPFVAVNVASLSPTLAESELFGHTRGAFSGATQERTGYLAQAHHGTLFLDEVADIPLPLQVKLLRALDLGEVIPVGSCEPIRTDFRVLCATHQDLLANIDQGTFRHDLYFRLAAYRLELPALRDRAGDVQELAEHFASILTPRGSTPCVLSQATLEELESRPWLGNVRELRNAVEHATMMARSGSIEPHHLPPVAPSRSITSRDASDLDQAIQAMIDRWAQAKLRDAEDDDTVYEQLLKLVEPPLLNAAMQRHRGLCVPAARQLGIHRTTLRKKLDEHE